MYISNEKVLLINLNNKKISHSLLSEFTIQHLNEDNYTNLVETIEGYYFAFIVLDMDDSLRSLKQIIDICKDAGVMAVPIIMVDNFDDIQESDFSILNRAPILISKVHIPKNICMYTTIIDTLSADLRGCSSEDDMINVDNEDLMAILGLPGIIYFEYFSKIKDPEPIFNTINTLIDSSSSIHGSRGLYININSYYLYSFSEIYESLIQLNEVVQDSKEIIYSVKNSNTLTIELFSTRL